MSLERPRSAHCSGHDLQLPMPNAAQKNVRDKPRGDTDAQRDKRARNRQQLPSDKDPVYAAPPFLFALSAGSPGSAAASAKRAENRCRGLGFAMLPLLPSSLTGRVGFTLDRVLQPSSKTEIAQMSLQHCEHAQNLLQLPCLHLSTWNSSLTFYHDLEPAIYSS